MSNHTSSGTGTTANRVELRADHRRIKQLGHWTTARAFEVRARHGMVVIDLRSPHIPPGDIDLAVEVDHSLVKLLVTEDAVIGASALRWSGRGKAEDYFGRPTPGGRHICLSGTARSSDIRIHRGGMAILSAMWSKAYLADLRRAHQGGGMPSVDDPSRPLARPERQP